MYYILYYVLLSSFLLADLDIYAQHLTMDNKNNTANFVGKVSITRDRDKILADKIDVNFDNNKTVKHFLAQGNVQLYYKNDKNNYYFKANKIKFKGNIYQAIGNVHMKNMDTKEVITANKISINRETSVLKIDGDKSQPVNMKLKIKQ